MKLYGLLVVQNESDIIDDLLRFLKTLRIYEKIFFFDLGSEDDTLAKALQYKEILHDPQVLTVPYTAKLRYNLLADHKSFYREGDWIAIIDADEFYSDDPIEFIRLAEAENATCIQTYQAEFMFTDIDLKNFPSEDQSLPIYDRRRYYLIDWSEERFYKYEPDQEGFSNRKPFSRRLRNRHYQYRTPEQIEMRIKTRLQNKKVTRELSGRSNWLQIYSSSWKNYIVPHRILQKLEDGQLKFGIPYRIRWKDYYSRNPFSSLLPQIATLFLWEQSASFQHGTFEQGVELFAKYENHRLSFRESFPDQVLQQVKKDFRDSQWKEAGSGLAVLFRFYNRRLFENMRNFSTFMLDLMKNAAWNLANTIKRLVSGKSIGVLTASPNPIPIKGYYEVGRIRLNWKTFRAINVAICLERPDGVVFEKGGASGSKITGDWITDDLLFYLQDVSGGLPPTAANTLWRVQVKISHKKTIVI